MGFAPEQVDRMTLWTFMACEDAFQKAYGKGDDGPSDVAIDEDRLRAMGIVGF